MVINILDKNPRTKSWEGSLKNFRKSCGIFTFLVLIQLCLDLKCVLCANLFVIVLFKNVISYT